MVAFQTDLGGGGGTWGEEMVFLPHQVHAMVLSHSNCDGGDGDEGRGGGDGHGDGARCDLLSFLIRCVELENGTGKIEEVGRDTVSTLLTAHGTELGDVDGAIWRLIYLYETNKVS